MSPEQAKGLELDGRSDIFSYGVVLYEMIESRNPFTANENIVTLYNILHRDVQFSRPAPEALRRIVRQALQKDRGRRYGDFSEIRAELAALKTELAAAKLPGAGKDTEVIAVREQDELLRRSDAPAPASDSERLSEMVRRLKNMKASTEALHTSGRRRRRLIAAALLLPAAAAMPVAGPAAIRPARRRRGTAPAVRVLLYPFANGTPDARIGPEIDFLLQEALNQSPGFKTLAAATVSELEGGGEITAGATAGARKKIRHPLCPARHAEQRGRQVQYRGQPRPRRREREPRPVLHSRQGEKLAADRSGRQPGPARAASPSPATT